MSLFQPGSYHGCSPFESPTDPTRTTLVFVRKTLEQNSAGELIMSWASALTVRGDLEPHGGKLVRYMHGELNEVDFTFSVRGLVDIRVTDRTFLTQNSQVSASLLEVADVSIYGSEHTEAMLQWVR